MKNLNSSEMFNAPLFEGLAGFSRFVKDPTQLDTIFEIAEKLIPYKYRELTARKMRARSPELNQAFIERVRISPIHLEDFRHFEVGTLGHAYFQFMTSQNLSPDSIPTRGHTSDADYFIASGYETHDIWHVVTGFDTSISGELGLQAFYTAQTPFGLSDVILFGGFLNALLFDAKDFLNRAKQFRRGRALGKKAKNLFGINWDYYWEVPLKEVRSHFLIETK